MIRAVIFDVDGTLIDSVDAHARAWVDAFRASGEEVAFDAVRRQIGKGADQLLPVFLSDEDVRSRGAALDRLQSEIFRRDHLPAVRAFADVRPLFERVRGAGLKIALASSANDEDLKAYKRIAGIEGVVDVETTSDDADASKPRPDIFQAALERLGGVGAEEAVVVGDTPWDVKAARRAHLACIGVLCGGWSEQDLAEAGAVAVFEGPSDLLARYDRSPLANARAGA